ncbi:hypothetical protein Q2K19_16250 [Micromonospora soli]|uniref:hypothetical protein n=1 Tax=Micromonospora sp. NBRC 110009 TaxID=3061627 RepID=UPI00267406D6|nr:hypothetical protein [Micromonospora sp. NBRC 110009]WKU01911.1 hypothetical protein Q2K19_16250 [Micromonospora sp. NBRC 110009]
MSDNYTDPSGNTAQFRAFVDSPEPAAAAQTPSRLPLIAGIGVAVVVVALIAWLVLG